MDEEAIFQFDDDVSEQNAAPAQTQDYDGEMPEDEQSVQAVESEQDEAPPDEQDEPEIQQTDAGAAAMLAEQLESARQEREQQKSQLMRYQAYMQNLRDAVSSLGQPPPSGDDGDLINYICAQAKGVTPDEYARQAQAQQQAREQALQNDPRYQQMVEFEARQRAQLRMANDLAQIKAVCPREQAADMEHIRNVDKYLEYFTKGIPAVEAYKLANMDMFARTPPKTGGADKQHLTPVGGGHGGALEEPPADVMELYRRMCPEASRKEIITHWNKDRKGA